MRTYHLVILLGSLLACTLQAVGQQAFLANAVRIGNQNGSTMMLAPASGGQFVATFPAASGTVALVGDVSASSSCCARDSTIIMIDHVYAPNNIAPVTSDVIELGGWEHSMTWLVSKDNIAAQDEMAVWIETAASANGPWISVYRLYTQLKGGEFAGIIIPTLKNTITSSTEIANNGIWLNTWLKYIRVYAWSQGPNQAAAGRRMYVALTFRSDD